MTDQIAGGGAAAGPSYASDSAGLREAAVQLEDRREAERASPTPDAPASVSDGEAFEEANFNRKSEPQRDHEPRSTKTAATLLSALRQDEQQTTAGSSQSSLTSSG